ncbi:FAD-binding domain-containing protein [Carboxylicivirga linearis]|uniref:Deoxyribodipyrimidine photo-lyase n=1 Tax=Carboxylicivirga linearis TaxID=1628157 RepID=A0ABS5K380_9BACT|nr:FAD-binding domain-containing protein [Carboxylicivirga linearis]MBS2101049.1 deoxyribodipyrimidine photo-lyase [Carboxylicivirga linearis]
MQPIIYWFRNDLRLYDNKALNQALESKHPIIFIYIINKEWFKKGTLGFNRISTFRLNHLYSSLNRLQKELQSRGSDLYIFKNNPLSTISKLAQQTRAKAVYAHHEYAWYELEEEKAINKVVPLHLTWGNMVYPPDQVPFTPDVSPYYYTKFMKKVIDLPPATIVSEIKSINSFKGEITLETFKLPETNNTVSPLELMSNYLNSNAFEEYYYSRELFEGDHYSSFLSPYLADGSLSANVLYQELNNKLKENPRLEASVDKLKLQLIWRDYYRFLFLRYGRKLFYRHGIRNKNRDRYDDMEAFLQWKNGKTDHPLVNAFMNELRTTGFLSNRGRMLVSYYLAKVLQVNWLWGAQWFEHILIDYEVCNNYGNWAYQSGVGTDSRFNRSFNLDKQIEKFDPRRVYLARWANKSNS